MIFTGTRLAGAFVIDLEPRVDERGLFARSFCEAEFGAHGLPTRFPQCNISRSLRSGTLRGMHFQAAPHREGKLVRCSAGSIFDVIIDLRAGSATRCEWLGIELTAESGRALFVPEGFAHGFITLGDHAEVFYHMSSPYHAESARGLRWNDPAFGVRWPISPVVMTSRDASYPDFDPATFEG